MINRTASKVHDIKKSLPEEYGIEVLDSEELVNLAEPVTLAVSCIPADKPIEAQLLKYLETLLAKGSENSHGVTPTLLEAAYKPRVTPIMELAQDKFKWTVVPGVEMLVHQGERQFELHTGFKAPYRVIYDAVVAE